MASYKGKAKHRDDVEICDGSKYSSHKNKRRNFTYRIRKKQERFTTDYMFVLTKSKIDGDFYSKDIGIDKEIHKADDADGFDGFKDEV